MSRHQTYNDPFLGNIAFASDRATRVSQCSIAGLSLGGWMAPRYVTVQLEKISSLVLLCPRRLTMTIFVVFGGSGMLLNAKKCIDRIRHPVPNAISVLLPDVGHTVLGQADRMLGFLSGTKYLGFTGADG